MVAGPSLTDRAEEIIAELSSTLSFTLDDGAEDDDVRFARVRASHAKHGDGPAAVGQDLLNHATLAARLRERLVVDDEEFEAGLIDEGLLLAAKLTTTSLHPPPAEPAETPAANDAATTTTDVGVDAPVGPLALRDRLLRLLVNRVALVRRAARRVFAKHPDVLAEVTSAYEREKRAERRRGPGEAQEPGGQSSRGGARHKPQGRLDRRHATHASGRSRRGLDALHEAGGTTTRLTRALVGVLILRRCHGERSRHLGRHGRGLPGGDELLVCVTLRATWWGQALRAVGAEVWSRDKATGRRRSAGLREGDHEARAGDSGA